MLPGTARLRQFIDARDVARFMAKVCETTLCGIYNLAAE
jgi:hypothetical protein